MGIKISNLPSATTPLTGSELVPVVQGGVTAKAAVSTMLSGSSGSSLVGFLQSGTSAVARTVQSKERDFVSALDFGADSTGVTDSTTALQAGLTAVGAAGGGTFYIPAGTYKVTNTLLIPTDVMVRGAGRQATILTSPAGTYAGKTVEGAPVYATLGMCAVNNASVYSLTVDHTAGTVSANGIVIMAGNAGLGTASTNCSIVDCEVKKSSTPGHQYCIWSLSSTGSKILYNYVDGGVSTNTAGTEEGIEAYGGTDILIEGNTVKNVNNNGIYVSVDSGVALNLLNIRVVNNYVTKCQQGIYLISATSAKNCLISNNNIDACWNTSINLTYSSGATVSGITIANNTTNASKSGINIVGDAAATLQENIVVIGNNIVGTSDASTASISSVSASNVKFLSNSIKSATQRGMFISTGNDIVIKDNNIDTCQTVGIYCYTLTRSTVLANTVREWNRGNSSYAGIYFDTCTTAHCDCNDFYISTFSYYPVYVPSTASDRIHIGTGNNLLYSSSGNPIYRNDGLNPNRGTFTLAAASTTKTTSTTAVNNGTNVSVWQTGGAALKPFFLTQAGGSFTLTYAAATGDETFQWIAQ